MSATVVEHWGEMLAVRAGVSIEVLRQQPERHLDFPIESVRVVLVDGSQVEFKYAFALVSIAWKAIAVFTEHCGHHVFPYHEAKVYQDEQLIYSQA